MKQFFSSLTSKKTLAAAVLSLAFVLSGAARPALSNPVPDCHERLLAYNSQASDEELNEAITVTVQKMASDTRGDSPNWFVPQLSQGLKEFGITTEDVPDSILHKYADSVYGSMEPLLDKMAHNAITMIRRGASQEEVDKFLSQALEYSTCLWGDNVIMKLMQDGVIDNVWQLAAASGTSSGSHLWFDADITKKVREYSNVHNLELAKLLVDHTNATLIACGLSPQDFSEGIREQYIIETKALFELGFARIIKEATLKKQKGAQEEEINRHIADSLSQLVQQWGDSCAICMYFAGAANEAKKK